MLDLGLPVRCGNKTFRWGSWFHPRKFATAKNYKVNSDEAKE